MLPPIRYPLPSLVALVLFGLAAWGVEAGTRAWRASAARRVAEALNGPPVPRSDRPQVVAGPIVRRALLLRDRTPIFDQPRGREVGTWNGPTFADLYDEWPSPKEPTHVRLGNRAPRGWVKLSDVLQWDTRLVVRPASGRLRFEDGSEVAVARACPVVAWRADAAEVVVWAADKPWEVVARRGWVKLADLSPDAWGVWISQTELPGLVSLALGGEPDLVRLRAVLGRVVGGEAITAESVAQAHPALPGVVFDSATRAPGAADRLAVANAEGRVDARWAGLAFRFLPLADLP